MKHIGIIGAGLSGLTTAKTFLKKGYRVTVLEKSSKLGGVWNPDRSYVGVSTQTTRDEYAFSDFPMPAEYPMWPSGEQVQEYLQRYAEHFDVIPHIRFNTTVQNMYFDGYYWQVRLSSSGEHDSRAELISFSYVVICTGTFHEPYLPELPGMDTYREAGGIILHSSEISSTEILAGKDVAVVGFAKSATDIATHAADTGKSCTLIYRAAQWKIPRYFGNRVNMRFLLFSRFSEAFFSAHKKSVFQFLLHTAGRPLVWAQWRGLELLLKNQFKLKKCGMLPSHRIEDQISCSLGVEPVGFYEKVEKGAIRAVCTEIDHFEGKDVVLKNGERIRPDLLVLGTGFRQRLPFLNVQYQEMITSSKGMYRLYRNILHPDVPQLGFVGFNSSFFSTITSEVAAHWLVAVVSGELILPPDEDIQKELNEIDHWRSYKRPIALEFSGLCVAPFTFQYLDSLMRDMGLRTKASYNLPYEFFKPMDPKDYGKILSAN